MCHYCIESRCTGDMVIEIMIFSYILCQGHYAGGKRISASQQPWGLHFESKKVSFCFRRLYDKLNTAENACDVKLIAAQFDGVQIDPFIFDFGIVAVIQ